MRAKRAQPGRIVVAMAVVAALGLPAHAGPAVPSFDGGWRPWAALLATDLYDVPEAVGRLRGVAPAYRCGDGDVDLATAVTRLGAAQGIASRIAPGLRLPAKTAGYVARLVDCLAAHVPYLVPYDPKTSGPAPDALRAEWLGTMAEVLALAEHPPALPASGLGVTCVDPPACQVQVGDSGDDTYTTDAVLIVDTGGSDTYSNNAAGANPQLPPLGNGLRAAVIVDLGIDHDEYVPPASDLYTDPTNGAGRLGGVGILVDRGGDDHYCGLGGTMGTGHNAGAGLLLDVAGSDDYESFDPDGSNANCPWDGVLSQPGQSHKVDQGASSHGGFGFLLDGGGDDEYVNSGVDGMGWGADRGTGLLLDVSGTDHYDVYPAVSSCSVGCTAASDHSGVSMGVGEVSGVGVLLDGGGGDHYTCHVAVTYGCMGASSGGVLGLLYDAAGDDVYTVDPLIPGHAGRPAGIGAAEAFVGEDPQVTGAGVLVDVQGGDTYKAGNNTAVGYGRMDLSGRVPSLGLFLDLGGGDTYLVPGAPSVFGSTRADGAVWVHGMIGIGVDV